MSKTEYQPKRSDYLKWKKAIKALPDSMQEHDLDDLANEDLLDDYRELSCEYCETSILCSDKHAQLICEDCYDKIAQFQARVTSKFSQAVFDKLELKYNCGDCPKDLDDQQCDAYPLYDDLEKDDNIRYCSPLCQTRGRAYHAENGKFELCSRPRCTELIRDATVEDPDGTEGDFCSEFCMELHKHNVENNTVFMDGEETPVLAPIPKKGMQPIANFLGSPKKRKRQD